MQKELFWIEGYNPSMRKWTALYLCFDEGEATVRLEMYRQNSTFAANSFRFQTAKLTDQKLLDRIDPS